MSEIRMSTPHQVAARAVQIAGNLADERLAEDLATAQRQMDPQLQWSETGDPGGATLDLVADDGSRCRAGWITGFYEWGVGNEGTVVTGEFSPDVSVARAQRIVEAVVREVYR